MNLTDNKHHFAMWCIVNYLYLNVDKWRYTFLAIQFYLFVKFVTLVYYI